MFPSELVLPYWKKYAVGCPPLLMCPFRVTPCLPIALAAAVVAFGAPAPPGAPLTTVFVVALAVAPSPLVAVAVLVAVPGTDTAATIVTVAFAPFGTSPSEHFTLAGDPDAEQLPCDAVDPNSVDPAGS